MVCSSSIGTTPTQARGQVGPGISVYIGSRNCVTRQ
jgi:hypothetical protein